MAKKDGSKPVVTAPADSAAAKSKSAGYAERRDIAYQVTVQISGLLDGLLKQSKVLNVGVETVGEYAVVRALVLRAQNLNYAAMSVLGDEIADLAKARSIVAAGDSTHLICMEPGGLVEEGEASHG